MKKLTILIFMLAISVMLSGCPELTMDKIYQLDIVNNSDHSIRNYLANGGKYGTFYPDTSLPDSNKFVMYKTPSGMSFHHDSGISWEEIYATIPSDTMSVFIFHTDTLDKYSWDEVREGYKILKRYDLSLKDLQNLDWKVIYPPSPEMKDMKMFPPYKEP